MCISLYACMVIWVYACECVGMFMCLTHLYTDVIGKPTLIYACVKALLYIHKCINCTYTCAQYIDVSVFPEAPLGVSAIHDCNLD